jgi:hypothetical protein
MNVSFNPSCGGAEHRSRVYQGEVLLLPANGAILDLVEHARSMVEAAFAPFDPRHAHLKLPVEQTVAILARLKPAFIHNQTTKELLRRILLASGCNPDRTYQDVPRLRVAYPAEYLTTGIAYAHHPHRDTWYSAPPCQLNWWMPIYEFTPDQAMAFHPQYWKVAIRNTSREFNYYRWNAEGRKNAAQHVKGDTRVQPHAEESLDLESDIRFIVPPGGMILFSAAHLHSTVRNTTSAARWSIDFRTVDIDDLRARRGAEIVDSWCSGTSVRDFVRMSDFAAMPTSIVNMHEDSDVTEGVAVFRP